MKESATAIYRRISELCVRGQTFWDTLVLLNLIWKFHFILRYTPK